MEIPEFIAGLVGGGFVGYFIKYYLDRRMQIVGEIMAQKRVVYAKAANSMRIFLSGMADSSPEEDQFLADYSTLWLWGSDEVIASLNSFLDLVRIEDKAQVDESQRRLRRTYGTTMRRMREDLRHTRLTENDYRFVTF